MIKIIRNRQSLLALEIFIFCLSFAIDQVCFGQGIPMPGRVMDCKGTLEAWKADPRLREYAETCRCDPYDNTKPPVCGSPGAPSMPNGRGLDPATQMALGIMQSFFSGFSNELFAQPDTYQQDALQKQQEIARQEEEKRQALKQWMDLQTEEELKRVKAENEAKQRGEEILAKASIGAGELKIESIGGGSLTTSSWDTPKPTATPAPSVQYDTSKFTLNERLLCAAYFSKLAEGMANSGDIEGARFYGIQIENVMHGYPTAIECKPPKDLSSTAMDIKKAEELSRKYTEMATLSSEIMPKIEKLHDLVIKLDEAKCKKEEAEQKIKEIDEQIEKIKARSQTVNTPETKVQEDDLLMQALALKAEVEKQKQEAIQAEENLTKEKQAIEEELNAIKDKMQIGGQKQ